MSTKRKSVIGIIVEWNPFHNGHIQHINKIKERYPNSIIVAAMSGSIVQRGELSTINKFVKAKVGIDHGVDIVSVIPVKYITQFAGEYAYGAVELLNEFKVERIIAGSETNDINYINKVVDDYENLNSKDIRAEIKKGLSFPKAISNLLGYKIRPNDLLNKSYVEAIRKINPKIEFETVERKTNHDGNEIKGLEASGSLIREYIENDLSYEKFIPKYEIKTIYKTEAFLDLIKLNILQSNEGSNISNQLKYILDKNPNISYSELGISSTAKSHTRSKVKRYMLNELFKIDHSTDDYYWILGFSKEGQLHLKDLESKKIVSTFDKRMINEFNIAKIMNIKHEGIFDLNLKYKPYKKN